MMKNSKHKSKNKKMRRHYPIFGYFIFKIDLYSISELKD